MRVQRTKERNSATFEVFLVSDPSNSHICLQGSDPCLPKRDGCFSTVPHISISFFKPFSRFKRLIGSWTEQCSPVVIATGRVR